MSFGLEITFGQLIYFCLKNKSILDQPKVPTKIDFLIIAINIHKIAEHYKTYIRQISNKWLVVISTGIMAHKRGTSLMWVLKHCFFSSDFL